MVLRFHSQRLPCLTIPSYHRDTRLFISLNEQILLFQAASCSSFTMPSKKTKRTRKPIQPWSMHSAHHDAVSDLLEEHDLLFDFHEDDDSDCEEEYDTNIMGRFICHNRACPIRGWSSKLIAITIRMYPGAKYNARVYHQRCKACNKLSEPILDSSYAERVAYRLKKWCGVQMELPKYSGRSRAPHESNLCEGCRHGHCRG